MTKFPHELPRPTSLITPPVHHSRPPGVETKPRFSDYRSNNSIHAGGNIGKGRGDDESHTHWYTHIGDKGSQTVIRSGGTTLRGAQVIGKGIRADSGQPKPKPKRTRKRQQTPPPIQAANTEINQHLDGSKKTTGKSEISQTEYDSQVANWQRGQVLLNSIATELSAPTQRQVLQRQLLCP